MSGGGRLVGQITLKMPGPPLTRHEPLRSANGRMYPHPKTSEGLAAWRLLWAQAGRPWAPGAVILEIYVRVERPASYTTRSGNLSALGRKYPTPSNFDLSNVIKLVEDALKEYAFGDDSLVASLHVSKTWATGSRPAGTEVVITSGARPL